MSTVSIDRNYVPINLREGIPIGGKLNIDVSGLTADTWYRLFPSANDGELDSDNKADITITVRSDVLDVHHWKLSILNHGYYQTCRIMQFLDDTNVAKLSKQIEGHSGLFKSGLNDSVEYIIFPYLVNPLSVYLDEDSDQGLTIGITNGDRYAASDNTIKELIDVSAGRLLLIPVTRIDKLFYKFVTLPSSDTNISWGEHLIG